MKSDSFGFSFLAIANCGSKLPRMNWTKMFVVVSCLLTMLVIAEQIYSYICLYDAAKSPHALRDCPKNCGCLRNITYPFGIGPKCFSDSRYEIDCQQTRGPVLKNLNVVVLNISLPASSKSPGLIKVRQPISYSHLNCTSNQQNDAPVNLTASNSVFRYSLSRNYFIAGGCDSLALIASADTPWAVAGCKSSCSRNGTIGFFRCSKGIGCCMTSISNEIGAYNVEFKSLGWEALAPGDAGCSYAFLVERKWWHKADLHSLPRDVPVVLEWVTADNDFNMGEPHCIATFKSTSLPVLFPGHGLRLSIYTPISFASRRKIFQSLA